MTAPPRPGAVPRCGWPVPVPGTTTTWWCNDDFGHDDRHKLLGSDGQVLRTADGYGVDSGTVRERGEG